MKLFRTRFGIKAAIIFVGLCALLLGAIRFSRDRSPGELYARWLRGRDLSLRLQAAEELRRPEIDSDTAFSALAKALLADRDGPVRKSSAISLGHVVSNQKNAAMTAAAARVFVRALADADPGVRTEAAVGLQRTTPDPEAVMPALLIAAKDGDEWVRGAAILAPGFVERNAAVDQAYARTAIVSAMNDPSFHVREMGLYAFWAVAEKSPAISIALLESDDVPTRRSVVTALSRSTPLASAVIPELIAAAGDSDAKVRAGANSRPRKYLAATASRRLYAPEGHR